MANQVSTSVASKDGSSTLTGATETAAEAAVGVEAEMDMASVISRSKRQAHHCRTRIYEGVYIDETHKLLSIGAQ